ncbi:hypothetical protein J0A67_07365 [Algoriphagus aestuariicola]|uniref:Uncharacterized protein n=1 Tax=Algoriphagus aestuariicola TaxID=1852016 RepID=A0ABS3BMZ5_9BACT|nr:hypothetical protein [Algoriphagus aestuariicola]MBN7800673.1 hypothetical protein [Algoriphagus aestuariicola]
MEHLMTRQLDHILKEGGAEYDWQIDLELNPSFLDTKGRSWLKEVFEDLGGNGSFPLLEKLKFDFKLGRTLLVWDDELHFNRYRLTTFRSEMYSEWNFGFAEGHRRLCRTYEKECLKAGMQLRIWNGPPVAKTAFGEASDSGDLTGNGATGWKLTAYNDAQYDLQTRLHGYKLIRLSPYETLMTGGTLKRLDQLLVNPKQEQRTMLYNWLKRKIT